MLLKLLAVAVGTFFAMVALLVVRLEMLARKAQERTGASNVAVDVYLLVHSTWLILSFIAGVGGMDRLPVDIQDRLGRR
jgi:hypothetical protein